MAWGVFVAKPLVDVCWYRLA